MKNNIMLKLFLLFSISFSFIACMNISTVKIPQAYNNNENRIAIVPVEISRIYAHIFGGEAATLGITGYLIGQELSASKRASKSEAMAQTLIKGWKKDWRPEVFLCDTIFEELSARGNTIIQKSNLISLPKNILDKKSPAGEWYNPNKTIFDHSSIITNFEPTVIIEAGFEMPIIFNNKTTFVTLMKVIDPNTSAVIARKRKVENFKTEDFNQSQPQQFLNNYNSNFRGMIQEVVPEMLVDMGF